MTIFWDGETGELNEIQWEVGEGTKTVGDLCLWLRSPTWRKVPMGLGFLLSDFFYGNEQRLYPPPRFEGGERYLRYCRGAAMVGWPAALAQLEQERERKRQLA